MAQDLFQYEKMVEAALRGVVRDALRRAGREGLRAAHHFYIGFDTRMQGVELADHLRAQYPEEMTIVLQHQFWDLKVGEEGFSVTLSFHKQLERLVIPFAAVRGFADPSVNFALEFAGPEEDKGQSTGIPTPIAASAPQQPADKAPADKTPADKTPADKTAADKVTGEVVTLDSFRKR